MSERVQTCDRIVVHVAGGANLYCQRPLGHDGDCQIMEVCPACAGSGRSGRLVSVRLKPPAATAAPTRVEVPSIIVSPIVQK